MFAGALIQVVPDLDVVTALWMSPAEALVAHRGFSHSFLFAFMFALFLSSWLPHSKALNRSPGFWLGFTMVQLIIHDVLDAFNGYGTAWFLPFEDRRISFHSLFVADPLFTLGPAVGIIALMVLRKEDARTRIIPYLSMLWCILFLMTTFFLKERILASLQSRPELQQTGGKQILITPMPFSSLLWFVAVPSDSGYYIGYRSVFENRNPISLQFIPDNKRYADRFSGNYELKILKNFSGSDWLITADHSKGRSEYFFTDLRFGIRPGWNSTEPLRSTDFVFRYPLSEVFVGRTLLQSGRASGLDKDGIRELLRKIFPSDSPAQSPK